MTDIHYDGGHRYFAEQEHNRGIYERTTKVKIEPFTPTLPKIGVETIFEKSSLLDYWIKKSVP